MADDYISLKNVRLRWNIATTGNIIVADAIEVQVPLNLEFFDRTPGGSWFKNEVPGEMSLDMTIMGWSTLTLSQTQLYPGLRLTGFSLLSTTSGTPSILPPNFFTWFPVNLMMLGNTTQTLKKDPAQWQTVLKTNIRGEWNPS